MHFYMWLPVELEPEYGEGFVCDQCGKEFTEGPFYHAEETGVDYCLECGNKQNLSIFNGIVSSLLFFDDNMLLKDNDTEGAVVVFGYKLNAVVTNFFFTNGMSVQIAKKGAKDIEIALFNPKSQQSQPIVDITERFPWATTFDQHIDREVVLHATPSSFTDGDSRIFLCDYEISDAQIVLSFNNGVRQVLNHDEGIETVLRQRHLVSLFRNGKPTYDKRLFRDDSL